MSPINPDSRKFTLLDDETAPDASARDRFQKLLDAVHTASLSAPDHALTYAAEAEQLDRAAHRDALTGLANRRYALPYLIQAIDHARTANTPLAILLLDIDHFKQINDRFSHATGDVVLKQVAELLQGVSQSGELAARLGGEEFLLVLPDTTLSVATERAESLREQVAHHDWAQIEPDLGVTVSIGVCALTGQASPETLLATADKALYAAKEAGRNQVCGAEE